MSADIQDLSAGESAVPRVAVIIPTFNRAKLLAAAIDSVLRQSYGHFELIVIDDGSTDDTENVVKGFHDPRLVFVKQENRGRSAARNRALGMTRAPYIAFLDSDDTYLDHKLEQQIDFMDHRPDVDMLYTSAVCVDGQGKPIDNQRYEAWAEGNIYTKVAFFQPVTITLPTVMLRREVLDAVGGFDEAMERFEDTDLWRRIAKKHRVGILRQPTCVLTTHGDNSLVSQNPDKIVSAIEYYVAKIFREDADVGSAFLRHGASLLYEYYGRAFLSVPGWRGRGISLLSTSIALSPRRTAVVLLRGLKTGLGSVARQWVGR